MPAVQSHDLDRPISQFVTPVQTTVRADQTLHEALISLRSRRIDSKVVYFYVVDQSDRLVGVVSSRALLLGEPNVRIEHIMNPSVIGVPESASLSLAMEMFAIHRLLALPVVDDDNHLKGIIDVQLYAEEMFDLAETHRATDLFQLIGLSVQKLREGSPAAAFRLRIPWLSCNLFGGIACAVIAAIFDDVLAQVLVLAMFIPLVLTLSESISVQSVTLGLQYLHKPDVPWSIIRDGVVREWKVAAMLGLALGATVGIVALFWGQGFQPPAVIAISVVIAMVIAATLGTVIPAALHAMRLDPKLAAGPVVLMITDIATLTVYLGLATMLLL